MEYKNILFAEQFDKDFLEHLYKLINKLRAIAKTSVGMDFLKKLLRDKRAMLYFTQPSTRTFMSFQNACQILGFSCSEVRDTSTSSEIKGESKLDSVRTFSSYVDLIIMRTPDSMFVNVCADYLQKTRRPIPIINAGAGSAEHPTQALLDFYTLQRSFKNNGGLEKKTILFCGDLKRGRTVKSLLKLLSNYNVTAILNAPKEFQIDKEWLEKNTKKEGSEVVCFSNCKHIDYNLPNADAVYMTRIQDEHDIREGESQTSYNGFKLNTRNIKLLKPNAIIMHPLPRRDEISREIDDDPRAMYWRQCRNGMWTRVALIVHLFNKDEDILKY